jgi:cytochrome c oxidase subunit 1
MSQGTILTTADHKKVGLAYLLLSLVFLLVGGAIGAVLKAELANEGIQLVNGNFSRLVSEHVTVSVFLFLAPAWVGLASYVVPLQIGAARLAFPRAMAFSLWTYAMGGALLIASYIIGPPGGEGSGFLGLTSPDPLAAVPSGSSEATDLWLVSLMVLSIAAIIAATTLAVTVLKLRTPGLTLRRIPMFSTASLVTSLGIILATPVFFAGLLLFYLDQHYGGVLFSSSTEGARTVWRNTVWLYGRPELFLLTLPALGAAADIVATHARRPFLDDRPIRAALALFGILSLGAFWLPSDAARAIVQPSPAVLNAVLGLPVAVIVLVLLGTLAKGRPHPHVSLLFVAGFVVLLAFGAANGLIAGLADVTGSAWTTGHLHVVIFGAPTLLVAGSIYHWGPKMSGRSLSNAAGGLVFLLLFGGFLLIGLGDYLLGYNGAAAHVADIPSSADLGTYVQLGTVGAVLLALGGLVLLADLVRALATKPAEGEAAAADPYEGLTLEWAAASPPPAHNFDAVPEVRSPYPVYDLRTPAAASTGGAE